MKVFLWVMFLIFFLFGFFVALNELSSESIYINDCKKNVCKIVCNNLNSKSYLYNRNICKCIDNDLRFFEVYIEEKLKEKGCF